MRLIVLSLVLFSSSVFAGPDVVKMEPETVETHDASSHDFNCTSLVSGLKNKFGFDKSELIASERSRENGGAPLSAMALKDGRGSTLRTFTGWADAEKTIPVYKIEIYRNGTENKIEVIALLKDGNQCHVNNIKVYRPSEASNAKPLGVEDCENNKVEMTPGGRIAINENQNDQEKACSVVWTYFAN